MPRALLLVALLALCLLAAACGSRTPEPEPTPTPTAAPTPEPTPEPEPEPTPEPTSQPEATPVTVTIDQLEPLTLDNASLKGGERRQPDEAALAGAAEGARAALEHYLNAQFISPETRFGHPAIAQLLTPEALGAATAEHLAALGQVPLLVEHSTGQPVGAQALVLIDGADVVSVTLRYGADVPVRLADGAEHVVNQRGEMVMVPHPDGWRAHAVDLHLDAPEVTP